MPERLVVDASAGLAILLDEPAAPEVMRLLAAAGQAGAILMPDHFWLEVTNVLVRRHNFKMDEVVAAIRELDELGLVTVALDRPTTLLGLDLMVRHGLSAYDAAYLALAQVADARLLTLDSRLASAAGERSALGHRPRTHEQLEPYEAPLPGPAWATHGRYLAELRRLAAVPAVR